jgi:branched-chain amino acid aminotransferase
MAKLQRPDYAFFEGAVRPWDECVLHVASEAVVRGLNVFEAAKAYWQPNGSFGFVQLEPRYKRMLRSARVLRIPVYFDYAEFERSILTIADALRTPESDLYVRATLFVTEGHYGEGTVTDLVLTAYQMDKAPPAPIRLGVSTWRRAGDLYMPPRLKTGVNYQVARLARLEGRDHGYDDMVLLNEFGRVAESTGAALMIVRDGCIYTPPATEGALESITLDIVADLCASLDIPLERRPVDRTELYVADEVAICGTLAEVTIVESVDGIELPRESRIFPTLLDRYRAAARGIDPHPALPLTMMPPLAEELPTPA